MLVPEFHPQWCDFTHFALPPITGVDVEGAVYVKVELERNEEQKDAGFEKDSKAS